MALYSADPDHWKGTVLPDIYPCDVVDGNGEIIPRRITRFDTETGEVVFIDNEHDEHRPYGIQFYKPPLTIIPYVPVDVPIIVEDK